MNVCIFVHKVDYNMPGKAFCCFVVAVAWQLLSGLILERFLLDLLKATEQAKEAGSLAALQNKFVGIG